MLAPVYPKPPAAKPVEVKKDETDAKPKEGGEIKPSDKPKPEDIAKPDVKKPEEKKDEKPKEEPKKAEVRPVPSIP